jgi:uncharacterized protein (TIGR00304 family)
MANELVQFGFLLTFAGIAIITLSFFLLAKQRGDGKVQGGGAVLIGPIPVVWGTDKKWLFVAIALLLLIMATSFIIPLLASFKR